MRFRKQQPDAIKFFKDLDECREWLEKLAKRSKEKRAYAIGASIVTGLLAAGALVIGDTWFGICFLVATVLSLYSTMHFHGQVARRSMAVENMQTNAKMEAGMQERLNGLRADFEHRIAHLEPKEPDRTSVPLGTDAYVTAGPYHGIEVTIINEEKDLVQVMIDGQGAGEYHWVWLEKGVLRPLDN